MKDVNEQEFVVGGFTEGEGSRSKTFGGLLVGYYDDQRRAAVRLERRLRAERPQLAKLRKQLDELRTDESPFVNPPSVIGEPLASGARGDVLLGEAGARRAGEVRVVDARRRLARAGVSRPARRHRPEERAPRGAGARASVDVIVDDAPSPVTATTASRDRRVGASRSSTATEKDEHHARRRRCAIKVTNLSKEFWPATEDQPARTKRDLIRYYARVAPYLVPHLRDRPLTLTRYPERHQRPELLPEALGPAAAARLPRRTASTLWSSHTEGDQEYILVNNVQTLVWLAQLADLEMHASMARVSLEPDAHAPDDDVRRVGGESRSRAR